MGALFRLFFALLVIEMVLLVSTVGAADLNILFILDGSGSMWGRVGDVEKTVIAKKTMKTLISEIPGAAAIGLMSIWASTKRGLQRYRANGAVGKKQSISAFEAGPIY